MEMAQDVAGWQGTFSLELAELHSRQRENAQKLSFALANNRRKIEQRSETRLAERWYISGRRCIRWQSQFGHLPIPDT